MMTKQNPASPDGNRLRDIIFAAIVGVDCTTVHRARIMSEGLADEIVDALASAPRPDAIGEACDRALIASNKVLYELDRPDADAKLAEIQNRHVNEDRNGCELGTVEAYCQTHNDRAYLLSVASEALQECERLGAALEEISSMEIAIVSPLARRALGAAK